MKIAVVQHELRAAPAQDLEALVHVAARAAALGAEAIVLPDVEAVHGGPLADDLFSRIADEAPALRVIRAHIDPVERPHETRFVCWDEEGLGRIALLVADACIDSDVLAEAQAELPGVAVLAPHSESELQAEAVLELAIALSRSLASVVLVVETDGAEAGSAGHGGSAILHLGEVLAEALSGDDLLVADVPVPLGPPEVPEALPKATGVLAQRLAAHQGRRVAVDYPADLG